jgi:hypothetical protein
MNVNAINRTIDAVRNDKTIPFNMDSYTTCIAAFAVRSSEYADMEPWRIDSTTMGKVLEINREQAFALAHPDSGEYTNVTREQAATLLENFRDTGKINWKLAVKGPGLIRKLCGKVRGLFS